MATTKSNCSLCDRNDILLLYDFVSAQIQNAFFTVNRNLFHKNFTDPIQLCVICSHKVELSSGIVREYKEMCNRNNVLSVKKCFFCEDKAAQLVGFRDNPNEVQDKIDVFLSSVNIKHNYRDLRSCIRCLYNLDVWDDIRRKLYLKMDIIDITPVNNNDKTRTNRTSIRATDSQPASDTTSAKVNRRSLRTVTPFPFEKSPASTPNKNNANKRQSANTPIPNKRKERSYRSVNNNTQKENLHWCKYLTNKLKNFQTVQQMVQTQPLELHTSQIDDNDKLFNTLPFVEILVSNQINKDRMAPGEDMETIVISDTEDPASNRRTRKTKAIPKSSPQLRRNQRGRKPRLRFKMPTKSKLSLIKSPPSFEETHSKSSASESQDSVQEVLSGSDSEQTLMCQVCDKSFTVKCEYLVHKLKHEKLEDAVVKVFRHSLPAKLNVSELSPKKTVVSPENINKLLTKWIGEHAAQAYADAEHNISEITADLNEKSGENEEESEKSKEESEKSEAESEKSEAESEKSNEESEKSNEESEKSIEESEKSKEVETTEEVGKQDETSGKDENIEENHDSDKNEENEKEDQNPIEKPGEEAGEKKIVAKETNLGDNNTTSADMDEIKHDSTDDEATNELEKEVIPNDKDKSNDGEKLQESEAEKTIEVDESESDEDASPTSPVLVEPLLLSKENEPCSKTTDNLENGNENESNCEGATINEPVTEVLNKDKQSKSDCFDEFSNSGLVSPPVMTCEDLINILETNIADDEESTTEAREADKRKRENDSEEVTPRRKRVRFADEKEVFTPYQDDGVSLEKIDESDHSADPIEDVEDNETETVSE